MFIVVIGGDTVPFPLRGFVSGLASIALGAEGIAGPLGGIEVEDAGRAELLDEEEGASGGGRPEGAGGGGPLDKVLGGEGV
jgi:hypothetical protein